MSISCDTPIMQPVKYCEHGKYPICCEWCFVIKMNEEIKALQEHKNRQIDENRKISKRVDAIEERISNPINFNFLKEKIEKLESYMEMEDRVTASDVLIRLSKLEDKVDNKSQQVDKDIKGLETEINTVRVLVSRAFHPKKPHKCPVCYGYTTHDGDGITECLPCGNKGVIWG